MIWYGACEAFRILGNAEQNSELAVLLAAFCCSMNYLRKSFEHTVISAKTAYTVYKSRRAWAFFATGLSLAKVR